MAYNAQELTEFYKAVRAYGLASPQQREGQVLFNVLCALRPDLAEQIRATNLDPFYDDTRMPDTFTWIVQNW